MNRLIALALAAPMVLVGAAHPDLAASGAGPQPSAAAPLPGPVTYRPCRPGAGDDNCIQLYERGVRPAYARWLRARGGGEQAAQAALGEPAEPAARAPRRHRRVAAAHPPRHGAETRCPPQAHSADSGETRGM